MDNYGDFLQYLGPDMSIKILMHLDDPSDLVRVCSVSKTWRQFVIGNDLCKQLCLKLLPDVSSGTQVIEVNNTIEPVTVRESRCLEWECLKRNHRVYAFLARAINPFTRKDCISEAINASSTDNYPEESIQNTLEPGDRVEDRPSYWSSKGELDPAVPETLIYKLMANMCLVTEIHLQPFQAYFQYGFPVYSAKAVRFRMGHPKFPVELQDGINKSTAGHYFEDEKFIWTYTSPEFPMDKENNLQQFKLQEPVLCVGGILQVELLGRVQRQEMDGLYYICISHVQVVGRPLLPSFDVEILDSTGKCTLKYHSATPGCISSAGTPQEETSMDMDMDRSTWGARGSF
ncbi:F-box-like domain-containing protein [Cephalotus follicularis]|uniref:F-box-like domain-containing protein n=1 Tax=Cephalotus follicularis TaxID=3775 RepID=A0A1Q3BWW7_CEPFO|nr:F-box-like domain-containing protein [Cephalotus follicularis]